MLPFSNFIVYIISQNHVKHKICTTSELAKIRNRKKKKNKTINQSIMNLLIILFRQLITVENTFLLSFVPS
jgi:hypothetical protein